MMMIHKWKLTAETLIKLITNSGHGRPTAAALRIFRPVEQRTGKDRIRNESVQR
jgi:hypothetical protein